MRPLDDHCSPGRVILEYVAEPLPIADTGLGTRDLRVTVANIIRVFLGLLGTVAVVLMVVGGFTWMTAAGNEENIGKAKQIMSAGVIGLVIILAAYALASFIVNQLADATQFRNR